MQMEPAMAKVELEKAESVPVNKAWESEADFSKWLHEHPEVLGDAMGCDLQWFGREISVGRFRADLVAEMNGYRLAAVEVQLDDSDHSHLGQSMTYAAGLEAQALIWIAPLFRNEHLLAIERLNIGMGQNLFAFAVRIKVEKTGSALVPKFEMLASPDRWFGPSGEKVDYRERRGLGFFERVREEIGDNRIDVGPSTDHSFAAFAPSTAEGDGVAYTMVFHGEDSTKGTSVHLWIQTGSSSRNRAIFERLQRDQSEIHKEVGHVLTWKPGPGRSNAYVIQWRDSYGSIDGSPRELMETREIIIDHFTKLSTALDKRLPEASAAARR